MRTPHLARLLLLLIPPAEREFIEGDLEEEFAARAARDPVRARVWYWREVLATVPWYARASLQRIPRAIASSDLPRRALDMAAYLGTPAPTPRSPAFGSRLIASRPLRQEGVFRTGMMSMLCHVTLLGSLVYSTAGNGLEAPPPPDVQVVQTVQDMIEDPTTPPPPEDAPPVDTEVPVFAVPTEIPVEVPPPGSMRIDADSLYKTLLEVPREAVRRNGSDAQGDGRDQPSFTPFTLAPRMENREEVASALVREYPPLLRDAGVGGTVEVWLHLDETGIVRNVQVNASSGQASLDEAALRVARVARFSPAENLDRKVPVWVKIPITFQAR